MRHKPFSVFLSVFKIFGSAGCVEVSESQPGRAAVRDAFVCPVTVVNDGKGGIYGNDALQVVLNEPENKFVFARYGRGPDSSAS